MTESSPGKLEDWTHSTIYKQQQKLEYPLVATNMSSRKFRHVKSITLCCDLKLAGFPYNFQRDIVAAPMSLLGMNSRSLYGTNGEKHIRALTNFGTNNSITGHHIRDGIEAHKLELGFSVPLLYNNINSLSQCFTPLCTTNTWKFMWGGGYYFRRKDTVYSSPKTKQFSYHRIFHQDWFFWTGTSRGKPTL